MQFDSQPQKNLVVSALNEFTCKLRDAEAYLRMARAISESPVVPKQHIKRKDDDTHKHDNKTPV